MKRIFIAMFILILFTNTAHAGWFDNLFSKKPTTQIEQKNNNTNSQINTTTVGATTIGETKQTVNIPENQKSYILNFKELQDLFQPLHIIDQTINQKGVDTLKSLLDQQTKASTDINTTLLKTAGDINTTSSKNTEIIVKPIIDISATLKDPPALKFHSETQSFIQSMRQDLITPLQQINTSLTNVVTQLSANNTSLTDAINNMSFNPGGSSTDTVQNVTATGTTAITGYGSIIRVDATLGNVILSLPDSTSNVGKRVTVIKTDVSTNTVTVIAFTAQTFSSLVSTTLSTQYQTLVIESDTTTTAKVISNVGSPSGNIVDTAFASRGTDQTGISAATDIGWSSAGNIPFNSGTSSWTLTAGKRYWLEAMVATSNNSANSAAYAWVDSSNVIITGTTQGNTKSPTGINNGSSQSNAAGYLTPTVDTVVKVRVMFVSGTMSIAGGVSADSSQGSSWADIRQIGTSAITGGVQSPVTLTTTGTSGASTFNQSTGALNIPNYTPAALEYIQVSNTVVSVTAVAGQSLKFTNIISGNIPYVAATGQFTLTAGKTYLMKGLLVNGPGSAYWYNVTGAAVLSQVGTAYVSANLTAEAEVFFTPGVNSIVEFRSNTTTTYSSANGLAAPSTRASIMQIR